MDLFLLFLSAVSLGHGKIGFKTGYHIYQDRYVSIMETFRLNMGRAVRPLPHSSVPLYVLGYCDLIYLVWLALWVMVRLVYHKSYGIQMYLYHVNTCRLTSAMTTIPNSAYQWTLSTCLICFTYVPFISFSNVVHLTSFFKLFRNGV